MSKTSSISSKSWEHLMSELSREILAGEYPAEKPLPGEHPLCERFNCSRTTVRRAMVELEKKGMIYRRHGKGTFAYSVQTLNVPPVGLLIRKAERLTGDYFAEIIRGCNSCLNSLGSYLSVHATSPTEWKGKLFSELSGVIVIPAGVDETDLDVLNKNNLSHLTIMESDLSGDAIFMEPERMAYNLCTLLLQKGHRNIGMLSGHFEHSDRFKRAGIQRALRKYGLSESNLIDMPTNYDVKAAKKIARKLLTEYPNITAVIGFDDALAIQVMAVAQSLGITVPDDLSVVGFNDSPFSNLIQPALTTVHFPTYDAGRTAAQMLVANYLKGKPLKSVVLESTVIERDSVSIPRKK